MAAFDRRGNETYLLKILVSATGAHPMQQTPDEQLAPVDLPQTFERRAFIRYARRFEVLWQLLGVAGPDVTSGQVFDLSATGVGIVADRPFPASKSLVLRLQTRQRGWSSHLVRVKHCTAVGKDRFQVGCAFIKPLSVRQLHDYLERRSDRASS
jgi:hypothetical protein